MKTSHYDKVTGVGFFLAILCFLSVITFHFPEYLSNPMMRASYDVNQLRMLLFFSLYLSLACGLIGLCLSRFKKRALATIALICLSVTLGGSAVRVPETVDQAHYYLSVDLIILDLLFMSLIFVPLERAFFLRKQRFLREGLPTDLAHYGFNHLLMGGIFFLIALPGNFLRDRFLLPEIPLYVRSLPIGVQVLAILFIADFCQYWVHRSFHTRPRLWQFHKIHHSVLTMDWLASSRLHVIDVIITRAISYIPIVWLGFSETAIHIYLPIVAIQALFVHSNVRFEFGWLRYVLTTPSVHHWHHSSEEPALDKNFAVSFSVIDVVFGTFYCPRAWPSKYGLHDETISENFVKQLFFPFIRVIKAKSFKG